VTKRFKGQQQRPSVGVDADGVSPPVAWPQPDGVDRVIDRSMKRGMTLLDELDEAELALRRAVRFRDHCVKQALESGLPMSVVARSLGRPAANVRRKYAMRDQASE
jgi:hypothetical protein